MVWLQVLQMVIAFCTAPTNGVSEKGKVLECQKARYECMRRSALSDPKAEAADSIEKCFEDPAAFALPAATSVPPPTPSVPVNKTAPGK